MFKLLTKSKIILSCFILIVLGFGYYYRINLQNFTKFFPAELTQSCTAPVTYKVGSFDSHFGISESRFKQAISDAAQIWDKALPATAGSRQLFQYQDNGVMSIRLIYDSRQQSTDQLRKLNLNVDNTQASYNQLKNTYAKYQAQYQSQNQQYLAAVQQYNTDKEAYDTEVQYWNTHGGAAPEEAQKLRAQRDQLNAAADVLNKQVVALNLMVDNINALARTLNRIGAELNLDVSAYNTIGKNIGEFEEGVYISDSFGTSVEIYQFDNYQALVRVLAHELGHSLGLQHVDDPSAIMYKLNQSKNAKPTAADIVELQRACKF